MARLSHEVAQEALHLARAITEVMAMSSIVCVSEA